MLSVQNSQTSPTGIKSFRNHVSILDFLLVVSGSNSVCLVHKKKLAAAEEQDTKSPLVSSTTDVHPQIIISAADAQAFEGGQMTKEKQQQLLSKILLQMEKNQLNEAKKKDQEETIGNISTQTISDDEFDEAYNSEEERERERFKKEVYGTNREVGDRDTRLKKEPNEEHTVNNQYNANKFGGGPRWGGHWRGKYLFLF